MGGILRVLYWIGHPIVIAIAFILKTPVFFQRTLLSLTKALRQREIIITERRIPVRKSKDPFFYDWQTYPSIFAQMWWQARFELWWTKQQIKQWLLRKRQRLWEKIQRLEPPPVASFIPFLTILLFLGSFSLVSWGVYQTIFKDLPSPYALEERQPRLTTKIYDRSGELLYTIFDEEDRVLVTLHDISPYLIQATIAMEDDKFYEHWGISFEGIIRAVEHNISAETVHGGSTITQQLVKNTLLTPVKTWKRKTQEAVLAVAVDAIYTKEEILERYLNEVNYGGSIYGVEQASQWYFSKSAKDLTLAESAFLAGLPVAPTAYSPFGPTPERAKHRQQEVLRRMFEEGYIQQADMDEALNAQLVFRHNRYDIKAPHFVMYVRDLLEKEYGEEMVSRGGLEVWTSLDLSVQASAEAAVRQELDRLGKLQVKNGASLVTNPRSGEILAMVGSRDYFDSENDGQVNVTLRPRQPGSSIKPITYATAFEHGYTPTTTIEDTPVVYKVEGSPPWAPKNYDGRFHGRVTLREALGSSYNIPAVRLIAALGVNNVVNKGRAMGISTWDDSSRFGFALTLGGGDVTMYDMAQVYGTLSNNGYTVKLNPILQVQTPGGENLYLNPCVESTHPCQGVRSVNPLAAYQVTSILKDNQARTPAFGPSSVLAIPHHEVAVKTGTTNNLRDNWTIGYTSDRVVVSWVGNNDNTPMSAVASGITGASPIWRSIMDGLLENQSEWHVFATPDGFERVKICQSTNTLPCDQCPRVTEEIFPKGMAPTRACTAAMFAATPQPEKHTARR
jgi:penicillin-binding protein 1C